MLEPPSSETLSCESKEKEPDDSPENATPNPHMNVIVKEEEEEEPLYGTKTTIPHLFDLFSITSVFNIHSCCSYNSLGCCFSSTDAKDPGSKAPGTKSSTMPAEPDRQQQESAEIRITVKEEEDEALNGERNSVAFAQCDRCKFLHPLNAT